MLSFTFCLLFVAEIEMVSFETTHQWNNIKCVCVCVAGASSSRKMAEVGALQRLPERKPAQRIPVRGDELVTVQLVQQVNAAHKHWHQSEQTQTPNKLALTLKKPP